MSGTYVRVARVEEIPVGEARVYDVGYDSIALCNVGGEIHAIENVCTHDDGPLGEGFLEGCQIECPRHGARFDVKSGAVTRMPAATPVRTFPVRIEHGEIYVEIEED
jgi:3-phenylpropionate/trans-cinnamate dioxygenase ferredoxin component